MTRLEIPANGRIGIREVEPSFLVQEGACVRFKRALIVVYRELQIRFLAVTPFDRVGSNNVQTGRRAVEGVREIEHATDTVRTSNTSVIQCDEVIVRTTRGRIIGDGQCRDRAEAIVDVDVIVIDGQRELL